MDTSQGDKQGDEYVLAGGSWSSQTVCRLGLRLPIQAGKGYSLSLPTPRQMPQLCSVFTEARVAVTPVGSTLCFGGTMEITRLDPSVSRSRVADILSLLRFARPVCWQDAPSALLPTALRDDNPDNIWRLLDSRWTQEQIL